jgi:hypothetical protein
LTINEIKIPLERPPDNGIVAILCHRYIVNAIAPKKYDKNKWFQLFMVFKSFTRKKMMASVMAATKAAIIPSFQKCGFVAVVVGGVSDGFFKSVDIKYTPNMETSSIGEITVPENNSMIIG